MKSLPPPLTAKEEAYYLKRYGEGDGEARQILIERNLRLVAHVLKKYQQLDDDPDEPEAEGELDLLTRVKEHCREHCAWLRAEGELEEYAMECLCDRAYRHWKDFEDTETIIWM